MTSSVPTRSLAQLRGELTGRIITPDDEELAGALRQGDDGVYVNFLADEGPDRVRAAYPGATWDRLTQVKARYDPTNLFHRNQNVPPAP